MSETPLLSLPLLLPSQAQKHVTVNEALLRLDGLTQLVLASRSVAEPPEASTDGSVYAVPEGAVNSWSGQGGRIAIRSNGGWVFVQPSAGWRAFIEDEWAVALHDGESWVAPALALSPGGAMFGLAVQEVDHSMTAGPASIVEAAIPANGIVFGVTGRVLQGIMGTASDLSVGVPGATDRYGTGIGLGEGAWLRGLTGTPLAYYGPTDLVLTANGGDFSGTGVIRIAVHYATLGLPREL